MAPAVCCGAVLYGMGRFRQWQYEQLTAGRFGEPKATIYRLGWAIVGGYFNIDGTDPHLFAKSSYAAEGRRAEPFVSELWKNVKIIEVRHAATVFHTESERDNHISSRLSAIINEPNAAKMLPG
jgi:hypothetical protein